MVGDENIESVRGVNTSYLVVSAPNLLVLAALINRALALASNDISLNLKEPPKAVRLASRFKTCEP